MSVDSNDIKCLIKTVVTCCTRNCFRLLKRYPYYTGGLLVFSVLYFLLPSVFFALFLALQFCGLSALLYHLYFLLKRPGRPVKKDDDKGEHESLSAKLSQVADIASVFTSNIRRRSLKAKGVDGKENIVAISKVSVDDSRYKDHLIKEKQGSGGRGNNENLCLDGKGSSSSNLNTNMSKQTSLDSMENSSENEEEQGGHKAAVEWNEDDQKNLMDLGLSEIERNRRLESLIARRRSRKFSKMNTEKNIFIPHSVYQGPIAPILLARNKNFGFPSCSEPGSAPSILLPNRNPFDIPYDPQEERPNLRGDSFQEEFVRKLKELAFSKHESSLMEGCSPLDNIHDNHFGVENSCTDRQRENANQALEVADHPTQHSRSISRTCSATDLVLQEHLSSKDEGGTSTIESNGGKTEKPRRDSGYASEIQRAVDCINHNGSESSSSTSSEDDESESTSGINMLQSSSTFQFPAMHNIPAHIPLPPCPIPRTRPPVEASSDNSSPSAFDRTGLDNHLLYTNRAALWHTPNNSIASDMQVEVSEIGSPPLTVDGTGSSSDGGESLTYDGDVEKEITSGSDEMWGISPHVPGRSQESEFMIGQTNEIAERGDFGLGNQEIANEFEGQTSPTLKPMSNSSSDLAEDSSDHNIADDDGQLSDFISGQMQSNLLDATVVPEAADSIQDRMTRTREDDTQMNMQVEISDREITNDDGQLSDFISGKTQSKMPNATVVPDAADSIQDSTATTKEDDTQMNMLVEISDHGIANDDGQLSDFVSDQTHPYLLDATVEPKPANSIQDLTATKTEDGTQVNMQVESSDHDIGNDDARLSKSISGQTDLNLLDAAVEPKAVDSTQDLKATTTEDGTQVNTHVESSDRDIANDDAQLVSDSITSQIHWDLPEATVASKEADSSQDLAATTKEDGTQVNMQVENSDGDITNNDEKLTDSKSGQTDSNLLDATVAPRAADPIQDLTATAEDGTQMDMQVESSDRDIASDNAQLSDSISGQTNSNLLEATIAPKASNSIQDSLATATKDGTQVNTKVSAIEIEASSAPSDKSSVETNIIHEANHPLDMNESITTGINSITEPLTHELNKLRESKSESEDRHMEVPVTIEETNDASGMETDTRNEIDDMKSAMESEKNNSDTTKPDEEVTTSSENTLIADTKIPAKYPELQILEDRSEPRVSLSRRTSNASDIDPSFYYLAVD